MRTKNVVGALMGGWTVYVVMACGAGADAPHASLPGAGSGAGGSDAVGADGAAGATPEGSMSPVPDAMAQDAATPPSNVSGSRLRARNLVSADGAKQFVGWRDTVRKEDCVFVATADGQRCLPTAGAASEFDSSAEGAGFADAGCSVPLFTRVKKVCATPAPAYGLRIGADACVGRAIYSIFAVTPLDPTNVYAGTPGACNAIKPSTGYDHFTGAPIALSEFVAGTETVE